MKTLQEFINESLDVSKAQLSKLNGIIEKSIKNNHAGDYVAVFVDTAGSIKLNLVKDLLSQIYTKIMDINPMRMLVIMHDRDIESTWTIEGDNGFDIIENITLQGRGGSDLKQCWDYLRDNNNFKSDEASLVVCINDGLVDQLERDLKTMKNLCWVILNNRGFELDYPDKNTYVVNL